MKTSLGFPLDTDPAVQLALYRRLGKLSREERLRRMIQLCAYGRQVMIAGIRKKQPDITEPQILEELAKRLLGEAAGKLGSCRTRDASDRRFLP